MKDVNLETITGTLSWCKILPPNGSSLIRAQQGLLRRRKGVYESFSSRRKSRKSSVQTILWNLPNPVKKIPWKHWTSTHHRSETNGIAERAVRRVKESTSAVLLQSRLDEGGGPTPWNAAFTFCETSKTFWQMGKRHTKGDSENHSQGQ